MKRQFAVTTRFAFTGTFYINAASKAEAKEFVENHCGLVIGGTIHSSSLLRFAHKTQKNRLLVDFLPCKLRKQPDNRGFFAASSVKNPQVQQAATLPGDEVDWDFPVHPDKVIGRITLNGKRGV